MQELVEKLTLPDQAQAAAGGVAAAFQHAPMLRTSAGDEVVIPDGLAHLFEVLARAAADGQEITVSVGDPRLRPREAAAELGMSRTYLCRLMDEGQLSFERVGTHRRIPRSEVDRYRRERADALAQRYAAATAGLPDVEDGPAPPRRRAPRRPGR